MALILNLPDTRFEKMRNKTSKVVKNPNLKPHNFNSHFAKKSFGQNFLVDENYIEQIIAELNPQRGETIIEIGAGRGALTRYLVESGANVLAVELDRDLIPVLHKEFSGHKNFRIIQADALQTNFRQILNESKSQNPKSKIAANLPYNISTAILQKLLEQRECFSELILMLQREVVERMTASPGNSERGYLSVLTEAYTNAKKLFDVPPKAFRPIPKVWSSVVRLQIKESSPITKTVDDEKLFWQIVSLGFAQKRKTILNNLKNAAPALQAVFSYKATISEWLESAGIEQSRRAETLTLEEWLRLADL